MARIINFPRIVFVNGYQRARWLDDYFRKHPRPYRDRPIVIELEGGTRIADIRFSDEDVEVVRSKLNEFDKTGIPPVID